MHSDNASPYVPFVMNFVLALIVVVKLALSLWVGQNLGFSCEDSLIHHHPSRRTHGISPEQQQPDHPITIAYVTSALSWSQTKHHRSVMGATGSGKSSVRVANY